MGKRLMRALPVALLLSLMTTGAFAQDGEISNAEIIYAINNFALFICAVLVLFMQAGFALVELGFNSSKNVVNIMFKNLLDLAAGVIVFWLVGFGLMYGASEILPGFLAWGGVGVAEAGSDLEGLNPQVDFLFQVAFAATAATIVSGAVAGRIKVSAYLIYTVFITALIYPISGFWQWGGGWLNQMGFHDFAGSLVVHAVGGFAGLAGAIVLGPRIGRFAKDGPKHLFAPHNYAFAGLGVFILWIGWYGFNPGSQLAFVGQADTNAVMLIAVNTTLAAGAGSVAALFFSWFLIKRPDLGSALNGALAGLVAITANCDSVTNSSAIIIGLIGGVIMVLATMLLERLKIDDPVGAWPVHGATGIWGGLAAAIFGGHNLVTQIIGSIAIPAWAFITCFILFSVLKALNQLRVSPEEEEIGLDLTEHGTGAYSLTGLGVLSSD
ncbi:MAG: ammonium transporter [Chloroflexota bacterium]|nr:MAG: ammonium transporter [Chloroflexota bacterium]